MLARAFRLWSLLMRRGPCRSARALGQGADPYCPGGGQAHPGSGGLCRDPASVGGGTDLRLDREEPMLRARLRATHPSRRDPHHHRRCRHPHSAMGLNSLLLLKHALSGSAVRHRSPRRYVIKCKSHAWSAKSFGLRAWMTLFDALSHCFRLKAITLPRLGSGVRIPSPAPDFKDLEPRNCDAGTQPTRGLSGNIGRAAPG
jgi:hypothetical protein